MARLEGKRFLVTGASSGIGRAVCVAIDQNGGEFVAVSRHVKEKSLESFNSDRHQLVNFDVTCFDLYSELCDHCGDLDGIVHSAGQSHILPIRNLNKYDLDQVMQIHLYAPLLLTKELLRARRIRDNGSVVFVSSLSTLVAHKGLTAYAMAKSGLAVIARQMTAEYTAKTGIRFNCVVPGLTETPFIKDMDKNIGQERSEELKAKYALGINEPEDVASSILFLLSNESRRISGSSLTIDGGYTSLLG